MIGVANYRYAADVLAEMQDLGEDALIPLFCVREALMTSDSNPRERFRRELYSSLDGTYAYIAAKHTVPDSSMIGMVKSLNDHILKYYGEAYGYETLDEFLAGQYLQVPQTFADISRYIGYAVTEVGDKAANWIDLTDDWADISLTYLEIGWENV